MCTEFELIIQRKEKKMDANGDAEIYGVHLHQSEFWTYAFFSTYAPSDSIITFNLQKCSISDFDSKVFLCVRSMGVHC